MKPRRALVLSGGGVKGAYHVGALMHLLGNLRTRYDIVCGISVGALVGSFISMYKHGEEALASSDLYDLWKTITPKRIYKKWPLGYLQVPFMKSVYNSRPLHELVRGMLDPEKLRTSGKELRVGAVSLQSGKYTLFSQDDPDIVDAVLASSSFPAMLLPVKMKGQWWTDGGIINTAPFKAAFDLGATEIDAILLSPRHDKDNKVEGKVTTLKVAKFSVFEMTEEVLNNDLDRALLINKLVASGEDTERRYVKMRVLRPKEALIDNSLDFRPEGIRRMIQKGYEDAQTLV